MEHSILLFYSLIVMNNYVDGSGGERVKYGRTVDGEQQ